MSQVECQGEPEPGAEVAQPPVPLNNNHPNANNPPSSYPSIKTLITIILIPLFAVLFWFIIAYCIIEDNCNLSHLLSIINKSPSSPQSQPIIDPPSSNLDPIYLSSEPSIDTDTDPIWIPQSPIKLKCPKHYCDKISNDGKCLIYIPSNTKEYHINATDVSNIYNNVTEYEWESDYSAIDGWNTA
eukprot:875456_1